MFRTALTAAACAAFVISASGAFAQDKPQEKPKETTIVIKDDVTPKAKKAAKATEKAAKKTADAVKDTKVEVKDDTKVKVEKNDGDPTVRTAGEATADAAITSAVKTKLVGDTKVAGTHINVDTTKGVVTLTGTVSSQAEKDEALRLARTTTGVHRVVDKLTVK